MAHRFYFAYGSNLDFAQMKERCPQAEYVGAATLADHELRMDSAGYATVVPSPGSHVQGVLWDFSESCEQAMDIYEGVAQGCYEKQLINVRYSGDQRPGKDDGLSNAWGYESCSAQGLDLDALVYTSLRGPFVRQTWRADYLGKVVRGARSCGLDAATRNQLDSIALCA